MSLLCVTPDLQRVICQWNGSRYGLQTAYKASYTMDLRWGLIHLDQFFTSPIESQLPCSQTQPSSSAWAKMQWTECVADSGSTERCSFQGDQSRKVRVKLSFPLEPLSRTFYTQEFNLHHSSEWLWLNPDRITNLSSCNLQHLHVYIYSYSIQSKHPHQTVSLELWKTISCASPGNLHCPSCPLTCSTKSTTNSKQGLLGW